MGKCAPLLLAKRVREAAAALVQLDIDDDNMPCRVYSSCIFPKENNNITREQDLLKFPSDCLALIASCCCCCRRKCFVFFFSMMDNTADIGSLPVDFKFQSSSWHMARIDDWPRFTTFETDLNLLWFTI